MSEKSPRRMPCLKLLLGGVALGVLLLAGNQERPFQAGDVARFAEEDVHGLRNDGAEEFVYLSVTAPPINFTYAYQKSEKEESA